MPKEERRKLTSKSFAHLETAAPGSIKPSVTPMPEPRLGNSGVFRWKRTTRTGRCIGSETPSAYPSACCVESRSLFRWRFPESVVVESETFPVGY
jgi:hypothetical protein